MKDSPLMLLLPVVVIMGAVGFMFTRDALSPTHEELAVEEKSAEISSSTSDMEVAEVVKKSSSSSPVDIFRPKEENESWTKRNLLLEEPCDFVEMEKFMDSLLAKPEWAEVIRLYPNRTYASKTDSPLGVVASGKWIYNCHLEVTLASDSLSQDEHGAWQKKNVLDLLNSSETYQSGVLSFSLDNVDITFLLADGPMVSSFGTYQYNNETASVRLFSVADGFTPTYSVYEADALGEEMCPCVEKIMIQVTNEISEEDIRAALEKGKQPDNFEE